ncbi:MAG: sel1 repeat family protein [archaeon]|nr:sel1 repeat family protein [archaeon]
MNSQKISVVDAYAKDVREQMDLHSERYDLGKAFEAASNGPEKSAETAYLLGLFLYNGSCTAADKPAAKEAFAKAAGMDYAPASIVLEEIGRNPEDVQDRLMKQRFLAEQRDLEVCKALFTPYDTGKDKDGKKAPVLKNHAEAVRLYMPCADAGDADALNTIGYMYLMGKGLDKDRELALKLLKQAAEKGCAQAAHRIAVMYDTGQDFTDPDLDKAVQWYQRGADLGYPESLYSLSGILMMKDTKYYNASRGIKYLTAAADGGQIEACHQLGMLYAFGANGVRRSPPKARKYLEVACEGGFDQAMVDYANMCFEGQAVPRDLATAAKWFIKAAEHYNGIAQYALGCMYGNGYYFKQDNTEAARWFEEAAEGGEPNAQYAIGCFYYEGRGVEKNQKKAISWFQEAADQGHPGAMSFMSMFLICGTGVEQDLEGGLEMLKQVADSGYPEAQFYLGKLYYEGEYVEKDVPFAKKMLTLAAKQGDMDAEAMLEEIKKSKQ